MLSVGVWEPSRILISTKSTVKSVKHWLLSIFYVNMTPVWFKRISLPPDTCEDREERTCQTLFFHLGDHKQCAFFQRGLREKVEGDSRKQRAQHLILNYKKL